MINFIKKIIWNWFKKDTSKEGQYINTEYQDPLKKLISIISKTQSNKKNKKYSKIHIYAPFGTGKTILVNNLDKDNNDIYKDLLEEEKNKIKNKDLKLINNLNECKRKKLFIKHDEFLYSKDDVDALFFVKKSGCIEKSKHRLYKHKKSLESFKYILGIIITIAIGFLPVYLKDNLKNFHIKLIPLYISFFPSIYYLSRLFIWVLNIRELKNKVIIIENIDRNEWDIIIYLFKKSLNSKNTFIFTYSLENLLERYKEKYHMEINLHNALDKFITHHIDLQKYTSSIGIKIKKKIVNDYLIIKNENEKREFMESINFSFFNNFRMLKRTTEKINKNWDLLKKINIDKQLAFNIEYLSISDERAYKWISKNTLKIMDRGEDKKSSKIYGWFDEMNYNYDKMISQIISGDDNKKNSSADQIKIEQIPDEVKGSLDISKNICQKANSLESHYDFINAFLDENAMNDYELTVKISSEGNYNKKYLLIKKSDFMNLNFKNKLILNDISNFNSHIQLANLDMAIKDMKSVEEKVNLVKKIDIKELNLLESMFLFEYIFDNINKWFFIKNIAGKFPLKYNNYLIISYIFEHLKTFYSAKAENEKANNLLNKLKEFIKNLEKFIKKKLSKSNIKDLLNYNEIDIKENYKMYSRYIAEVLIMSKQKLEYKAHYRLLLKNRHLFNNKDIMYLDEFIYLFYEDEKIINDSQNIELLKGNPLNNDNNEKITLKKWMDNNEWKKTMNEIKDFYISYKSYWKLK